MVLQLTLMVFLLQILCNLWLLEKHSNTILRKLAPTLVFTLSENGGLNQVIFLLLFLLPDIGQLQHQNAEAYCGIHSPVRQKEDFADGQLSITDWLVSSSAESCLHLLQEFPPLFRVFGKSPHPMPCKLKPGQGIKISLISDIGVVLSVHLVS